MEAATTRDNGAEDRPATELENALSEQMDALSSLAFAVATLHKKLAPVLVKSDPQQAGSDIPTASLNGRFQTQRASSFGEHTDKVRQIDNEVNLINQTLHV